MAVGSEKPGKGVCPARPGGAQGEDCDGERKGGGVLIQLRNKRTRAACISADARARRRRTVPQEARVILDPRGAAAVASICAAAAAASAVASLAQTLATAAAQSTHLG